MSEEQQRGSSVVFLVRNGPAQFSTPLPLSPWPCHLGGTAAERELIMPHALIGLLALTISTAAAPIERVHLLIQNQNEIIKSGCLSTPYKGMTDCFLRTIKQEGLISMWRGNSINVLKVFTSQALAFAIMKNSWHNEAHNVNDKYGHLKFEAAVCAGTLLQYPLDYARTRLATDVKAARTSEFSLDSARKSLTRQFSGMFDVYRKTLRREGIIGLYRGYYLSLFGFLAWDSTNKKIETLYETKEERPMWDSIKPIAMAYSLPVALYPMTSLSRRMMMNSGEGTTKYKNPVHAFSEIVKHEGFSSLYSGVTAGMTLCLARLGVSKGLAKVVELTNQE
ncbi:ADP ATP carrier protein mitochondrial [Bienertia sinuspersici]